MQKEYLLDTLPTDFCFTADYPVHIICRVIKYLQGQTKSTGPEWLRHHLGVPSGVLFFYVIKLEWRAVLKLNKDLWPLVHKCSHTHGTIKALSSEGSWKRIWLEFKTAGNQEKKVQSGFGIIRVMKEEIYGPRGRDGHRGGTQAPGSEDLPFTCCHWKHSGRNKVFHCDVTRVVVTASRGHQLSLWGFECGH